MHWKIDVANSIEWNQHPKVEIVLMSVLGIIISMLRKRHQWWKIISKCVENEIAERLANWNSKKIIFCDHLIVYPSIFWIHDFQFEMFKIWKFQRIMFFLNARSIGQVPKMRSIRIQSHLLIWISHFYTCSDRKWILGVGNRWSYFVIKRHLKKSKFCNFLITKIWKVGNISIVQNT